MRTHPFLRCVGACRSLPVTRTYDYAAVRLSDSDGEALAAFGAACVQHGTTRTGGHACAETMGALAADDGRLVSTFHFGLAKLYTAEISKKPGRARQGNQSDASPCRPLPARSAVNPELDSSFCISVNHLGGQRPDCADPVAEMASRAAADRQELQACQSCDVLA